ncbi:MAG: DUF1476 domain-containing protein [Alphaproteobacteria bacterium]|jgi:hypothetical protein|uniref:DUF1476 domain-containing protein n=1 Tax=Celeribacter baekdonensis TaxID=875171 RepID=A0A1G7G1C9_9RHOB|nr:DUF1476 domain-containing protein [Celeribacter baekdonensis]MBU0644259.1 DUF1476 domain-containing protein [Alphaproteobacteria bacterium]MBU1279041.1 DUF1476 domain-containing protein [Alphaproteobacteria bacterium]MBU1574815.1 DUF1476 domain-containing protein [Alphaproteobacteria bacterium]MBU1827622.1 DUF1476 domain-containing protein [Alphaproteobacteria bacterium]MBU2079705.1 DUF1476 domain-containing protein [Alphaproteobacteria bacterium]
MTTFDDREAAFESKFAHDAEAQFRLEARADKKIALWAADIMGKSAADALAYVAEVIRADMQESGAEDVIAKVAADLGSRSTAAAIREKYAAFMVESQQEMMQ